VKEDDVLDAVREAFVSGFHSMHDQFREQVQGLDRGTLNWSPLPKANSIAVLVTHSLGSEREMLHGVRNVVVPRDRDSEFKVELEATDLLAMIDAADRDVDDLVGALVEADLTKPRPRGANEPRPGIYWLVTNYGHSREHLAQIMLTKQLYDSRT
jgi:DinB superfamily